VCYVVKNSLPWKRGEKHSKIRDVKKQKLADLTGGGNSNDIAHRSLIQVNTVVLSQVSFARKGSMLKREKGDEGKQAQKTTTLWDDICLFFSFFQNIRR